MRRRRRRNHSKLLRLVVATLTLLEQIILATKLRLSETGRDWLRGPLNCESWAGGQFR